ncbi:hypothetical protein [Tsukamurella pulmonis]|uniref:hypothetical protein n=1 Tax=Tsukamurella pulmonis TaxID=47312 RepID=UPI001EDDB7F4|nr:hypothetical protein [Tsukamurella pulmonis]
MQAAGVYLPALGDASPAIKINTAKLSGNADADVALIAHELGHALGLSDTSSGRIMDHSGPTRAFAPTGADLAALRQALSGCADLAATAGAPYGPMYGCGWFDKVCGAVGDTWSSAWEGVKDIAGVAWDKAKATYNWASDPAKCAYEVGALLIPMVKILQIPRVATKVLKLAKGKHDINDYQEIVRAWDRFTAGWSEMSSSGASAWDKGKEAVLLMFELSKSRGGLFAMTILGEVTGITPMLDACGIIGPD